MTLSELQSAQATAAKQATELKTQIEAETARQDNIKALRQQRQDLFDEAELHRKSALTAKTLELRESLLNWAKDAETEAAKITIEGEEPTESTQSSQTTHQTSKWNFTQLKKSATLAAALFLSFIGCYFIADISAYKTLAYAFEQLSRLCFGASILFASASAIFFAWHRYFPIVLDYLNADINALSFEIDFKAVSPVARLFFLLGLLFCFVIFCGAIIIQIIAF